jgi:hypothetical protein
MTPMEQTQHYANADSDGSGVYGGDRTYNRFDLRRPLLGFGSELELPRLPPESLHLEEADVEVPHGAGVVEELQWHVKAEPARGRSNLRGPVPSRWG